MLTQKVEHLRKEINTSFVYPQYDNNCISEIPNTILRLFDTETQNAESPIEKAIQNTDLGRINKVVLLVIDGFGFYPFLNYCNENRFLNNLVNNGDVYPLTSVFPSQTTNALATLNTGLTPSEHGLFEYFIYLKNIGLVNTLHFRRIGSKYQKSLIDEGFDPSILMFKDKTIHSKLKEKEVSTYAYLEASNAFSECSKLIFQGSKIVPTIKNSDSIVGLRKNLEENYGRNAYFFVHLDTLDTISHQYGPESYEFNAELSSITYLINKELIQKIDPKTAKETLLLVTADHGSISVDPKETIYLNSLPKTILNLQIGKSRHPILPTGSPREIFLHIKKDKLAETKAWLKQKIGQKAQILETEVALKQGLFGLGVGSREILDRIGNLMILPYGNNTVWIECSECCKMSFLGQHGGLSEQEMLVPFAVARLSNLKENNTSGNVPVPHCLTRNLNQKFFKTNFLATEQTSKTIT